VDTDTGELRERRLQHPEDAERFYRDLAAQGMRVRVGMEASVHARWYERLLVELNFELWIGDAAEIRPGQTEPASGHRVDHLCVGFPRSNAHCAHAPRSLPAPTR